MNWFLDLIHGLHTLLNAGFAQVGHTAHAVETLFDTAAQQSHTLSQTMHDTATAAMFHDGHNSGMGFGGGADFGGGGMGPSAGSGLGMSDGF